MVTIKDVAREANMSVATVSRVLNGSGPVSEKTRRLIHDVAGKMRYVPHSGARSLITSKTETLGVLLPDLYGEFFSEVIRGMDDTAQRNGFHLLISRAYADRHGIETAIRAMRGRVDGVVVMSPDLDAESLLNMPSTMPVVLLCSVSRGNGIDSLTIQNCRGAREMVGHLVSLGHKRIAIIKGSPRNYDAAERLRGYRIALREAGIVPDTSLELTGNFTEAGGYAAAIELLAMRVRPTAIFAANDSMAIGALSALRESGVEVPEDMAVAGFDDIPLARYMDPPLSSVHVPICELGARAVEILLEGITHKNGHARKRERVSTKLVIRSSTGRQPAERPPPKTLNREMASV
ncbi:MAG TPA: LacI family DNA-binding transcriptional regulator [Gemmatimonadaceae bacterium]|jgi:LacI family transcriptional regulator|nr:LacI family DNA-binding transcriptional regulator [Gemmatimonadaceae bacterium]